MFLYSRATGRGAYPFLVSALWDMPFKTGCSSLPRHGRISDPLLSETGDHEDIARELVTLPL